MSRQMSWYVPQSPTKQGLVNPRFRNAAWWSYPPLTGAGHWVSWSRDRLASGTGGRTDSMILGTEGQACCTASAQRLSGPDWLC